MMFGVSGNDGETLDLTKFSTFQEHSRKQSFWTGLVHNLSVFRQISEISRVNHTYKYIK